MSWSIQAESVCKRYKLGTAVKPAVDTLYQTIERRVSALTHSLTGRGKPEVEQHRDAQPAKAPSHLVLSPEQMMDCPPGHFWALKDVSFQIEEGDRVGIVGKNGSGKSTLLKILSRITTPTSGQFRFRGRLVSLLEVGTGFHPDLSGRENIILNAKINGMTSRGIRQVFNDIVDFSELGRQIDTPIKRYSSGMYMRLAFSVAAHLESEILIVDEVLAVGDAGFQKKCLDKMLEVSGHGRTLLFVSHDMNAISSLCNKALEMSHGRIVVADPSSDQGAPAPDQHGLRAVEKAISDYVLEGGRRSEITWPAESAPAMLDGGVRIHRVWVANAEDQPAEDFDVSEDIHVSIEFDVLRQEHRLNAHIYVFTLTGQRLFVSMDNQVGTDSEGPRPVGRYRETCTIPRHFLGEGTFRVEVIICTNPTTPNYIAVADAVSFGVNDDRRSRETRGDWEREWPDYPIRPRLQWNIERTGDGQQ
ncbi:hypothetical protein A7P25_22535 [Achromobacter xylosoxidans]|nr:hypothetical protein A7P25_22535 [Achromobacter xylosoxidans]